MKTFTILLILICISITCHAQLYFPPKTGDTWATVTPQSLGWNSNQISPLLQWLDEKNTKAFIVLKDGKIVIEEYFDTFTQDSLWYWASAGKTVTAFLVGIAQQEGFLSIHDKASVYLGKNWTLAPAEKEDLITIWHQLTMTSGLDDGLPPTQAVPDPDNCLKPECLVYKADAGTRWAYHNAPYRLLQDVVPVATLQSWQQYTNQKIKQKIGMSTGVWYNYVFWSRPRDMARFGLLALNKGVWENEVILQDTAYFNQMVNTSQQLNKSYGYLWWLNGKGEFMLPQSRVVFPLDLIPSAPDDTFMALGKDDQKIYVVPSQNIVVIRMGESAEGRLALSAFDDELWQQLMQVIQTTTDTDQAAADALSIGVFPNPGQDQLQLKLSDSLELLQVNIFNVQGQEVKIDSSNEIILDVSELSNGIYFIKVQTTLGTNVLKWVMQ
ncbi:MAG: serine hydrolase [Saprospiraceae bacterium]|nr:serine hydrolase [Saprospiraceae bacterium]